MEAISYRLPTFEGPLDLLLFLIQKNKLNIYDIPIAEILRQYLDAIEQMKSLDLDIASEFLEMAARLVQMKSYLLLPRSEEAERLKQVLTGQLIEYSACKRVAAQLRAMQENVYCVVRSPAQIEPDHEYRLQHDKMLLLNALQGLSGRSASRAKPTQERFEPLLATPFVSVGSRVVHVLRGMLKGKFGRLSELFSPAASRSETVATFLAVLELVRAGRLKISNEEKLSVNYSRLKKQENA